MDILEYETISTPQDKQEVINMIKEAAASLLRTEGEASLRKDIAARAKEEFEIPAADFNKVVKMYHKQNRIEEQQKYEKVDTLYEKLFDDEE
ncbi:DsbA dsDNA binding protein late transcription [Vibrio phage nt-1]|uniref:DsbA dsDNA binding protein late transcription n=1 Tax=Vibrio phage nt-1 TaxID=115992 RepID=R9TG37_9CAUD|nr:transcriptional regulator [Vibrio phage nt-1]AGN30053.1 DsbA dsDNA binding protein late transcription [Vibrio phage nt-1]